MAEIFSFKLTDDFVSSYKDKQVPWGYRDAAGNSVGEITFIRTYSRLKQDGSKERWYEVCNRVINGIYSIQKNWAKQHRLPWNDNKAQASAKEAFDRMFNLKWTPPGRGLWLMGTEVVMERNLGAGLQNCFAGNTKIITKYGPRTLSSLNGEEVDVWIGDSWQKAVVNSFGVQKLQRVSFKPFADRSNVVYHVDVTPDHRWILDSGFHTTNIEVGDVVKSMPVRDIESIDEYNAGVRHGVIFGDGCMGTYVAKDGMMSFSARLCGKNATEMYKYFEKFTSPPSANGDQIAHIKSYENLKDYPLPGKTADYIGGFVRGWLLADSSTTPSGSYRLASQKSDSYKWLLDNAATAGFAVNGHSLDNRDTNFGPRSSTMHITVLTPMFKKFKVVSIIDLDEDIVYCPVVPIYSRFVLANGLLTGNCGFVSTYDMTKKDPGEPFAWAMDALMCGIGVGFDVRGAEKDFIVQDPTNGVITYTIPDSREGWAESIRLLVNSYLVAGESSVRFDYSQIRPYGEPIKGFGGTASGPAPLRRIHNQIATIFSERIGEKVDSRLICDIMNLIGTCVVAGNVRRSAELALGTVEDKAFMNLKNQEMFPERNSYDPENPGWGWMSNNSVSVKVGDDYNELFDLIRSNGEPGLVWLDTTRNYGRMVDGPDGKDWRVAGYNPCAEQPLESKELCVAGDTMIQTRNGLFDIKSLVGKNVEVWNGKAWSSVKPFETGKSDLYRVTMSDGSYLDATPGHRWSTKTKSESGFKPRTTLELVPDMYLPEFELDCEFSGNTIKHAYAWGWFAGDGYVEGNNAMALVYEREYDIIAHLPGFVRKAQKVGNEEFVRINLDNEVISINDAISLRNGILPRALLEADNESIADFIGGLIDTDGSLIRNAKTDHYVLYGKESLLRSVQLLGRRIGINHSTLKKFASAGDKTNYGTRNYDLYRLLIPSYEVFVVNTKIKVATRFGSRFGNNNAHKNSIIDRARKQKIVSIEKIADNADTYCFSEPETGMGVFNNVLTHQCTLVEVHMNNHDSIEDFQRTLKFAYLYGKTITLVNTHWPETNAVMQRNRRIGTSLTGVAQFADANGLPVLKEWMKTGYDTIKSYDRTYSEWLCVRESIRTTTVKPSGTVSILSGHSPGVHWTPGGKFFMRAIRFGMDDLLVEQFRLAGYKVEDDVVSANTVVVYFPIESNHLRSEKEVSIFEKLNLAAFAQRYWSDNGVSCTVSFNKDTEGDLLPNAVYMFDGQLKAVSFLPMGNETYPQMPYTQATAEEYREYGKTLGLVDLSVVYDAGIAAIGEKFCSNDTCTI